MVVVMRWRERQRGIAMVKSETVNNKEKRE